MLEFSIIMHDSPRRNCFLKVATHSVLIEGGPVLKDLLARFIHANSPRFGNPHLRKCALTESLLESELLHERGPLLLPEVGTGF